MLAGRRLRPGPGAGAPAPPALGLVKLHAPRGAAAVPAEVVRAEIWQALEGPINRHLVEDGKPPVAGVGREGIGSGPRPAGRNGRGSWPGPPWPASSSRPATARTGCGLPAFLDPAGGPRYEVIVVDNARPSRPRPSSSGGTRASPTCAMCGRRSPGLRGPESGAGPGRGQIVAFTDDDAVVDRHWLTELARGFERGRASPASPVIFLLSWETLVDTWSRIGACEQGLHPAPPRPRRALPPHRLFPFTAGQFGSGPNMAFRVDALRRIGGFEPALCPGNLGIGGEDLDVFFQTIQEGHQFLYEPAAQVFHLHRRDFSDPPARDAGLRLGAGGLLPAHHAPPPRGHPPDRAPAAPWAWPSSSALAPGRTPGKRPATRPT